jgi:hypothetical protein
MEETVWLGFGGNFQPSTHSLLLEEEQEHEPPQGGLQKMKNSRWGKAVKLVIFATIILSTSMAVFIRHQFNPPNHLNFSSTKGNYRLLAVAVDSADGTILVKACDWPHTFFSPFVLGDAIWPEKYASAKCHWSRDGTLAVWEVQEVNEKTKRYEAGYDFREHLRIDLEGHAWNTQACNEAIAALVVERGGVDPTAIDIPTLNSGLYQR